MKASFAIFVLVAIVAAVTGKTFVFAWYSANQTHIAKTLCENRAKPKSKCNGKCYLAKQLKKADGDGDADTTAKVPASQLPQSLKDFKDTEGNLHDSIVPANIDTTPVSMSTAYTIPVSVDTATKQLRPPIG